MDQAVSRWFQARDETPLVPPPRFREYAPALESPDTPLRPVPLDAECGVSFGLNYCDLRGWTSARTIRCIGTDHDGMPTLWAYCNVRKEVWPFRIDRVISTVNLRTGAVMEPGSLDRLLRCDVPTLGPARNIDEVPEVQRATRDSVYVLLSLAMRNGCLSHEGREVLLSYIEDEMASSRLNIGTPGTTRLWLDNLSPRRSAVVAAVERLFTDLGKLTRTMAWSLKAMAADTPLTAPEQESARELIAAVRDHYRWMQQINASLTA